MADKDTENTRLLGRTPPSYNNNNQQDANAIAPRVTSLPPRVMSLPPKMMSLPPNLNPNNDEEEETKQEEESDHEMDELINKQIRILDTKIAVSNLSEIDTASRTFRCNVEVTLDWDIPEEELKKVEQSRDNPDSAKEEPIDLDKVEYPTLYALNARELELEFLSDPEVVLSADKDGKITYHCVQNFEGLWEMEKDEGELDHFPFDFHNLPIKITSKTASSDRFRVYNEQDTLTIYPSASQEFDGYMCQIMTRVGSNPTNRTYDGRIDIIIRVRRCWRYYFNQVAIFVFLLSVLVLPGFAMGPRDVSDKLSYFVTLLLAQTALLYFISGQLPKLAYFTVLDEYILGNFMLTLGAGIQTAVMTLIEDDDLAEVVDNYCMYGFVAVFVFLNVYYIFDSWRRSSGLDSEKFVVDSIKVDDDSDENPGFVDFEKIDKAFRKRGRGRRRRGRKGKCAQLCGRRCRRQCCSCSCRSLICCGKGGEDKADANEGDAGDNDAYQYGGPVVFYKGKQGSVGKYRSWRTKYEKFQTNWKASFDFVIILFGPEGSYKVRKFWRSNGWKMRKFKNFKGKRGRGRGRGKGKGRGKNKEKVKD